MGIGSEIAEREPVSVGEVGDDEEEDWDGWRRDWRRSWLKAWTASVSTSRESEACLRDEEGVLEDVDVEV